MAARFRHIAFVSLALIAGTALAADNSKSTAKTQAATEPVQLQRVSPGVTQSIPAAPGTPSAAIRRPALTSDQKALEDILQRGQAEVATLTQGLQAMPLGSARQAVERKVVATKVRVRVEFLRTLAAQQRARGDVAAAQVTDGVVDQLLHPKPLQVHAEPQSPNRTGAVK